MTRIISIIVFCIFVVSCGSNSSSTQRIQIAPPLPDQSVADYAESQGFSGGILIAKHNEVIFRGGVGYSDQAKTKQNNASTLFRIGSLTKQFTALLILQLQEQGLLNVNDPINLYLDDFPNGEKITIHHLLSNGSGIANYTELGINPFETDRTVEALIGLFVDEPLSFDPGSQFEYSNSNFVLLGAIIEVVTGQPYSEVLVQNIFIPLGMENSQYNQGRMGENGLAFARDNNGDPIAEYFLSSAYAAGAIASSIDDMYLWHLSLSDNQLISDASAMQMLTRQNGPYGYGMFISEDDAEVTEHLHQGYIFGYASLMVRYPDEQGVIIILGNGDGFPTLDLARELRQHYYD